MNRLIPTLIVIGSLGACLIGTVGCEAPQRKFTTYPPGTLPVKYEEASAPTSCLVASVTMAANYLLGERKFSEPAMRTALKEKKLDETSVADMKTFLTAQGLDLITLSGQLDGKPTVGLRFWVERKGYPVICIINRRGAEANFNHAVVVTGFSANVADPSADIVYYLDPSTRDPLQSSGRAEFETFWARGDHAMMVVVAPPPEASGATSAPAG